MRPFHIATVANDARQYQEMRSSFERAGFTEEWCRYTLFDNTEENRYEPYAAMNAALQDGSEPYVILCHQDVRTDRGDGRRELLEALEGLERERPHWAVAGNAGIAPDFVVVARISDPHRADQRTHPLPRRVTTLDENFLVVRRDSHIRSSPELRGFHFYAADICLHAARAGFGCFVVDFHLTHLSGGSIGSTEFREAARAFSRRWSREFAFCCLRTTAATVFLSRYATLRALFGGTTMRRWVITRPRAYRLLRRALCLGRACRGREGCGLDPFCVRIQE